MKPASFDAFQSEAFRLGTELHRLGQRACYFGFLGHIAPIINDI